MEKGILANNIAEECDPYLIPFSAFPDFGSSAKKSDHCIVFCKKISPDVFSISKGVAVMNGNKGCFTDGICMVAPETKVVFVFENN